MDERTLIRRLQDLEIDLEFRGLNRDRATVRKAMAAIESAEAVMRRQYEEIMRLTAAAERPEKP